MAISEGFSSLNGPDSLCLSFPLQGERGVTSQGGPERIHGITVKGKNPFSSYPGDGNCSQILLDGFGEEHPARFGLWQLQGRDSFSREGRKIWDSQDKVMWDPNSSSSSHAAFQGLFGADPCSGNAPPWGCCLG